jgi:hypothetical protein
MAKGTEVLLTFVDGDPDRPLIAGAINTAAAPGPVTADNQTESVIQTGGNNKIRMEDKVGSERLVFESPASNSWIRVGAKNDPPILNGSSGFYLEAGASWTDPGAKVKVYSNNIIPSLPPIATFENRSALPADVTRNGVVEAWSVSDAEVGDWLFTYRVINAHGNEETATRSFTVYDNTATTVDGADDDLSNDSDGIRIRTAGNLWLESHSRFAEYVQGTPAIDTLPTKGTCANEPSQLSELRQNFDSGYTPSGMLHYKTKLLQTSFPKDVLANAHVKLSSFDTVTTQEGNIYDFGGYWNYNLGNSYAEDHVNQKATLNSNDPHDMLNGDEPEQLGPLWKKVDWPLPTGAKSGGPTIDLPGTHWTNNQDDYPAGGKVWVQKKWGNDYEYHVGDSISVSEGNTLNVVYGGDHTEAKYSGTTGNIYSWTKGGEAKSWSSDGTLVSESKTVKAASGVTTDEKKYDYNTGDLCSHSTSAGSGMGLAKFDFDYSNTVAMSINSGSINSMDTYLGMKSTMSNHVAMYQSMDNFIGGKLSMNNFLGVSIAMSNSAGAIIEIKNGEVSVSMPGMSNKLKAMETKTQAQQIETTLNSMKTAAFDSLMNGLTSIC